MQACNLIIPIASIGIINAVIRFGLEENINKKGLFSFSLWTCLIGFCLLLIAKPLFMQVDFFANNIYNVYLFIFTAVLQSLFGNFIKSQEKIKLYTFDGVLRTVMTIALNVVFLAVYDMGIAGYLLATIISNFISMMFLFFTARLYKYISFDSIDKKVSKSMLKYAIPLIPTTVAIWVINLSDRYILSYIMGNEANGLYSISYKIPSIITIMVTIFIDAWQISSVNEYQKNDSSYFFSKVFSFCISCVFIISSIIIAFTPFATSLLVSESFYSAWRYTPVLIISTIFACLAGFLSTIYTAYKKSTHVFFTTVVSAVINIALNFTLIPIFGIQGAGIATVLSYLALFLIRAMHSRAFVKINLKVMIILINTSIIIAQTVLILSNVKFTWVYQILCIGSIVLINIKAVLPTKNHK